VTVCTVFVLVI